jgi:hypothetical protein
MIVMPDPVRPSVMLVITAHVTGQKPLHETAQRLVMRNFNHKVKTILFWDVRHRVLADFNVLNGAKRLNPSIELRAGIWNVWSRRKPK